MDGSWRSTTAQETYINKVLSCKARVQLLCPKLAEQIFATGSLRIERGNVKYQSVLRLMQLTAALLPIHFCGETGCFVYHFNVLQAESF